MPFDKTRALEPIEFIPLLKHTGDFYGRQFTLLDWQYDILWNVYGTMTEKGLRQYQYSYLEVPKKNGKTELVAAIAIYHLECDPPGGQIYCCAAEKAQAGLTYNAAKQMIEQDESLSDHLKVIDSKKEIHNLETKTFIKVLSAEAYSKHGLNPTVVIFDELHAQPSRELWDVMTFGAGSARKEPLWWVITTAGDDPDKLSIGWEIHEKALRISDGRRIDKKWFVKIYGAVEDANIYDEKVWYDCNPSLGVSISIDTLRSEAEDAKDSPYSEKLFRWLRLNQWVSLKRTSWIPLNYWDMASGEWALSDMTGMYFYCGLDLSSTTDLTAIALLFPPQRGLDEWRVCFKAYIPMDNINDRVRRDKVPYDLWVKSGHLTATDGNAVDYEVIKLQILLLKEQFKLKWLCADKWQSEMMRQELRKKGVRSLVIEQTMAGMTSGMKEFERLLRGGELTHDKNPVARWCFGNVSTATDGNENIKPMKNKSIERIDLMVALIDAMAGAFQLERKLSAYEDHGIRTS